MFCLIFLVALTVREFYILEFLQNSSNPFLYLWEICAIQPTRRDLTKCYKSSRCAYVHTKTVTLCEQVMVQLWAICRKVIWLNACEGSWLEHVSLHWLRQVSSFKIGICGIYVVYPIRFRGVFQNIQANDPLPFTFITDPTRLGSPYEHSFHNCPIIPSGLPHSAASLQW